jgi:branched-chain amino acid transport system substrate-binding protein
MLGRRSLLAAAALCALMAVAGPSMAADAPGVTKTEIKIGNIMPYSGPASAYGVIGKAEAAYFQMINENGGINGRKINFVSVDDGYAPPKAVEMARKLVEQDGVAIIFNSLGTPSNTAIQKYLNAKKVPQLFVATGADKWGDYKDFHWTMGWQPSYRTEAQIYAKYILKEKPDAKIGILYQNDDFGKDYLIGVKDVLGDKYSKMVTEVSYEVTDPTIDSQVVTLKGAGVDVLITAATPKFAAQTIRKVYDIGWKPLHFMTNVSISIGSVFQPAGLEKGEGIITSAYGKDPTDPTWKDDPGMNEWRAFMTKHLPGADQTDASYVYAYGVSQTLVQVLKQCGDDVSRENIMKQAANLKDFVTATSLPGIKINTSPTNYHPFTQMQLQKFDGKTWVRFGDVISGAGT